MKANDLIGKRSGRLVVVRESGTMRNGRPQLECICDCGNVVDVVQYLIVQSINGKQGGTKSCGCMKKEALAKMGKNNRKRSMPDAVVHTRYEQCKSGAISRKLEFDLSEETFFNIASLPCSYCGSHPKEVAYRVCAKKGTKIASGVFIHGIDRVDNGLGYVFGNLAPCCGDCNRAKGRLTVREFRSLVAKQHAFMPNKTKEKYMGLDTQDVSYAEAA